MNRQDKTFFIRNAIFNDILSGKYTIGQRLPTENEISTRHNVSRVTVRRAYGALAALGILERRQGNGTFVADTRWHGNSEEISQVAFLTAIKDPFAMEFLESFQKQLDLRDLLCILKITEQDPAKEEQAAIELVGKGVRNMIIWPSRNFHCDTFSRLRLLGTNMVFFDRMFPGEYADYVGLDNDDAVGRLIENALANNVERLFFVSHSGLDADSDKQREKAFLKYCSKHSIEHYVNYVPWQGNVKDAVCRQKHNWLTGNKTAIICVNDLVAVEVRQNVDDSVLVYGIDGLQQAVEAGITTVKQPFAEMAKKCIELLCRQQKLGQRWKSRKIEIKGSLVKGISNES